MTEVLWTRDDGFLVGLGAEEFAIEVDCLLVVAYLLIVLSELVVPVDHVLEISDRLCMLCLAPYSVDPINHLLSLLVVLLGPYKIPFRYGMQQLILTNKFFLKGILSHFIKQRQCSLPKSNNEVAILEQFDYWKILLYWFKERVADSW